MKFVTHALTPADVKLFSNVYYVIVIIFGLNNEVKFLKMRKFYS